MKNDLKVKRLVITFIPILVLSIGVGALVLAQGKDTFKTTELINLENYKAELEKNGQPVPEEIERKIELQLKESNKLSKEQSKRDKEVLEMKQKLAKAPKDEKGNAILEDAPKPQKPEPYEDVGAIYYDATNFFPAYYDKKYEFSTVLVAPYNILISGNIKENNSTGFIYIINNDTTNGKDGRVEYLYPDVGEIKFEKLTQDNSIAIFSYGNGKEGYFDISKDTAFFTPYIIK